MTSFAKKKAAYDPTRQWGLRPDADSNTSGTTYVVSGHIVSDRKDSSSMFINESLGRDAQAKATRKMSAQDGDKTLEQLLKRDKEGMKAVKAARAFGKQLEKEREKEQESGKKAKGKEKEKERHAGTKRKRNENLSDSPGSEEEAKKPGKNAYNANLVRSIGFDPTAKDGRKARDSDVQKKVCAVIHQAF
jgi:minichromosome maintenance protein 10